MASKDLDSGVTAEELEASFKPKAAPKPKSTSVAGLTAKQKKEINKPSNPTKLDI